MDFKAIFNLFLIIGAIQGFAFVVATFFLRKKIERTVLFLNLFVLFLSLNNLNAWLIDKGFFGDNFIVNYLNVPWYILIVPMFYSFLVHYLGIEDKKWPFFRISAALFLCMLLVRFSLVYAVKNGLSDLSILQAYGLVEEILAFAYSMFLYIKSIGLLTRYQQLYQNILSYDNLRWIRQFLRLGAVVFLFWLVAVMLNSFTDTIKPPYSYYPLRLSSSILIYWVAYQAFFRYVVLNDRIALRSSLKKKSALQTKSISSKQQTDLNGKSKEAFDRVNRYVVENKSYLNPAIGLESLAKELEMGASSLSKLINENVEGNFSDYINQFRVEEAKRILKDNDFEHYTIVSIGLECGFNSKSTFYTAFKKFTGMTPVQFRKMNA